MPAVCRGDAGGRRRGRGAHGPARWPCRRAPQGEERRRSMHTATVNACTYTSQRASARSGSRHAL